MRKGLLLLLFILTLALSGCKSEEVTLDKNFDLSSYKQENEEIDSLTDYIRNIESLIDSVDNHDYYPASWMSDLATTYRENYDLYLTKEDYELTNQTKFYQTMASITALGAVDRMENDFYGSIFKEAEEFTHFSREYNVFVNANYIEYTISYDDVVEAYLSLVVENDNIIYEYYVKDNHSTNYYKNDYTSGYLHVYIYENEQDGNYVYSYEFFNYETLVLEKLFIDEEGLVEYSIKDIANGKYIRIKTTENYTIIDIDLLDGDYIELGYNESRSDDELMYTIRYNMKNINNWDTYRQRKAYKDEEEVLSDYNITYYVGVMDIAIEQQLDTFNENDFNSIDGSSYSGSITYQNIQDVVNKAEELLLEYYSTIQDESNTITYIIDNEEYTFEEAKELFKSLIRFP